MGRVQHGEVQGREEHHRGQRSAADREAPRRNPSPGEGEGPRAVFEKFIAENKDHITALQFFFSVPYAKRPRFDDIKALADKIHAPPRSWTPELLWRAYEALDRSRVKQRSGERLITDVVALVRFALHRDDKLVPFAERVDERFKNWLAQQETAGTQFTAERPRRRPSPSSEAGAISKAVDEAHACTLLVDVEPAEVEFPLAMFQATRATRDDVLRLVRTVNATLRAGGDTGRALADSQLDEAFGMWWPRLEQALGKLPEPESGEPPRRTERDMISEVLEHVRELRWRSPVALEGRVASATRIAGNLTEVTTPGDYSSTTLLTGGSTAPGTPPMPVGVGGPGEGEKGR